jgi:hypothetical protein
MEASIIVEGSRKRQFSEFSATPIVVPTLEFIPESTSQGQIGDRWLKSIASTYKIHQAVYLPNYLDYTAHQRGQATRKVGVIGDSHDEAAPPARSIESQDIHDVFARLNQKDKDSFCIENEGASVSSPVFLRESSIGGSNLGDSCNVGYCSFLVQSPESLSELLGRIPVASLRDESLCTSKPHSVISSTTISKDSSPSSPCSCCRCWDYDPCLWIFFGRNRPVKCDDEIPNKDLQGRPEHTDSISHDGTWHYQLSGTKRWILRPTRQLVNQFHGNLYHDEMLSSTTPPIIIECRPGDVLLVNTRLWHHQTILPSQPCPSISYARDFWMSRRRDSQQTTEDDPVLGKQSVEINVDDGRNMKNVDGVYAIDDIDEGTILFKESDMPDCELHRSATNPNCQVVDLDDGTQAVVSTRKIIAGEFFCTPESSDEEEEEYEVDDSDNNDQCRVCP